MTKEHYLKVESNFGSGRSDETVRPEAEGPAGGNVLSQYQKLCSRDKIRQNDYCLLKYV